LLLVSKRLSARKPHVKRGAKYLACGFTAGSGKCKYKFMEVLNYEPDDI